MPRAPIVIRTVALFAISSLVGLTGCFVTSPNAGGGQSKHDSAAGPAASGRAVDPSAVALPAGYRIEAVLTGLTYPTAVAFDDRGTPYVVEGGYSYGEDFTTPGLYRFQAGGVDAAGDRTLAVAKGDLRDGMSNGAWSGAAYHDGAFYVCEGGARDGGRILRIDPGGGGTTVLVDHLPSTGDHQLNGPVVIGDWLYFSIGTATNSGVVGLDNDAYGWLRRHPTYHDIPARDVTLAGVNFTTDNPLAPNPKATATTGAFVAFGTPTQPGQVIKGQTPCNGGVFRMRLPSGTATRPASEAAAAIELVAWGLRNPFGLAAAPGGRLFVTENSFDVRGSRPVWGTGDLLWAIDTSRPPLWYGWPDYFGGERLADNPGHYRPPGADAPKSLLAANPNDPPKPVAWFGVHSSSSGLDFDRGGKFGHPGDAFVAQFGDLTPSVGKLLAPVGFKVVHVDVTNGVIYDFAVNRGKANGPASKLGNGGLERPVACRFSPAGDSLYVVDFGVLAEDAAGKQHPVRNTGVLWRITRTGTSP